MQLFHELIQHLKIKRPVNLLVVNKNNPEADAEYEAEYSERGRLTQHHITIFFKGNYRDFDTLLAHELIHAWQEEHKLTEHHGPEFKKLARKVGEKFSLPEIYVPDVDID